MSLIMEKKISSKVKKKLDNIIKLKSELKTWKNLKEEEVFKLVKEFEKTPRDEVSNWYKDALSDSAFSEVLLNISKKYEINTKMNVYITSALGNMIERYDLEETKTIYDYFLNNKDKKEVSVYVSLFITKMEHFKNYSDKWEYIMSVKNLKPSKIAESSFDTIIKAEKDNIPEEYISTIQNFYKDKADKANNEHGKKYYLELAEQFQQQTRAFLTKKTNPPRWHEYARVQLGLERAGMLTRGSEKDSLLLPTPQELEEVAKVGKSNNWSKKQYLDAIDNLRSDTRQKLRNDKITCH